MLQLSNLSTPCATSWDECQLFMELGIPWEHLSAFSLIQLFVRSFNRPSLSASWLGKIPWRRESLPTPVFWPGEFHGQSMGRKESDTTE